VRRRARTWTTFPLRETGGKASLGFGLSGGVMVAQESLELFVMVRIHAGQPTTLPRLCADCRHGAFA
jgi:hypothetical protein